MSPLEQLINSIDARITQLNSDMASLEAARSALISEGASLTSQSPAPAKSAKRRRRPKLRTRVTPETAEKLLAAGDGLTTSTLAEQAGADRDQVLALLRDLEQAQRVRRTGQRRGTRWHVITDEDRIRERAAELASRSRRRRPSA
jgi:ribosomal 50S subunit-associated protein YjgA (DUF615 family)